MWGLIDCDNCYCSCERVFRPDLNGKPVVVLSNNDGCVIARSQEAKAMGVKMGLPYYQLLEQFPNSGITAFSSNYTLYGDMSARVMSILKDTAPEVIQYSIDEAFLDLRGMENTNLKQWGEELSKKIKRWTGMPVSIGIAPTKTLAKIGSKFAKKYPGYNKCCVIANDEQRTKALKITSIEDVWGIGRKLTATLTNNGIKTAFDFTQKPASWIRQKFHITGERTWSELRGKDCIEVDDMNISRKSIMTSRSFPEMLTDINEIKPHIANYAARCAEKLRRQKTVCSIVTTFIDTNHFREDLLQYGNSAYVNFNTPTNNSHEILDAALSSLKFIYKQGFKYKRAGVMVSALSDERCIQPDIFSFNPEKRKKLDDLSTVIDIINKRLGSETVVLGAQQYIETDEKGKHVKFQTAIRRTLKSPNYSTDVNDFSVR